MRRRRASNRALILAIGLALAAVPSLAQDATLGIAGRWRVEKRDAIIEIAESGNSYVGRVVWAKDRDGIRGDERLDVKNPDPALRSRKVLGVEMLTGLPRAPDSGRWSGKGRIYNPKTGKSYPVKVRLDAPNRLRLRVGGSVIGQTTYWTRVE